MTKEKTRRRGTSVPRPRLHSRFLLRFPHALLALSLSGCSDAAPPFEPDRPLAAQPPVHAAIEDALDRLITTDQSDTLRAALLALSRQLTAGVPDGRFVDDVVTAIDRYASTSAADADDVAALRLSVELLTSPEN